MNKIELTQKTLERGVERAKEMVAKHCAEMAKSLNSAEYTLRWSSGLYLEVEFGRWCETALDPDPNSDLKTVLRRTILICKQKLSVWQPEYSSSPQSNACKNEEFMAMRRFIETFERAAAEMEVEA